MEKRQRTGSYGGEEERLSGMQLRPDGFVLSGNSWGDITSVLSGNSRGWSISLQKKLNE